MRLTEIFFCQVKKRDVTIDKCTTNFVNANVFEDGVSSKKRPKNKSVCRSCSTGRLLRKQLAEEGQRILIERSTSYSGVS